MFKVIIVEDELPNLQLIKMLLAENKNIEVIGEYLSSNKAWENIQADKPDAVFLDIEMPGMNGLLLAEEIKKYDDNIQVVFMTAYNQYAVEAFRINAIHYILKPISEEAIDASIERLLKNKKGAVEKKAEEKYLIECFGTFKVFNKTRENTIKWITSKSEELFAYFICNRGQWVDKWKLCDMFWNQSTPKNAEHNLHSTINRLKNSLKSIGIENIIEYSQGMYKAYLEEFDCDLWKFDEFMRNNSDFNICDLERIAKLSNSELFEGKDYPWCTELRENYNRYYTDLINKIVDYYSERADLNKTEMYISRLLELNPLNDNINEKIIDLYYKQGNLIKSISQYKKINELYKKELGIEFTLSNKELYKRIALIEEVTEV
ncbi:response regulator [Clostridium intestinale]|uniref:response regulator n=1 Tax=Clostridium intestinale TaxID=36845 RepID=UPI0028ED8216|nr:response regulator [Clostridium intestinale]